MIDIKKEVLVGKTFSSGSGPGDPDWVCIGVCHPYYVVGIQWDQTSNRTFIKSFAFKEVQFKGDLTKNV